MDIVFAQPFFDFSIGISPPKSKQIKECLQMLRCYGFNLRSATGCFLMHRKVDMFVNVLPMPPTHNLSCRTSAFPSLILPFAGERTKHNTETFIYTHEQAARCQRQDHLYIQPRKAGKPVCGFMKRQTAITGRNLLNAISRNFKKAVRREVH